MQSAVSNMQHFIEKIKNLKLEEQDILAGFDVTSLFTNVPTKHTLAATRNTLFADTTLHKRTSLSVHAVIEPLSICVNTILPDGSPINKSLAWQ